MVKTQPEEIFNNFLIANKRRKIILLISLCLIIFLLFKGSPVTSWGYSSNYENVSVRTEVNVTNSYPEIINITCNGNSPITLNAGSTQTVSCIIEIQDYNGWNDITSVNGTFYYSTNESTSPDDNNSHYTNTSCNYTSNDGQYLANWTCFFDVWYYANNGTWEMNATVNDTFATTDNDYSNVTISALLALNVTDVIDFGNLAVTDTSNSIEANVTNFGNVDINVSVWGFGSDDSVAGAGFAMMCAQRNLTIDNERYSLNQADAYAVMTQLSGASTMIPGIMVQKQTIPSTPIVNSTFWRVYINLSTNPFGMCNGTVVFAAESP